LDRRHRVSHHEFQFTPLAAVSSPLSSASYQVTSIRHHGDAMGLGNVENASVVAVARRGDILVNSTSLLRSSIQGRRRPRSLLPACT
jgi:hypothetical protein